MKATYSILFLCMLMAFSHCKRDGGKRTAAEAPAASAETPASVPETSSSTPPPTTPSAPEAPTTARPAETSTPAPSPTPAAAPKAQAEGTRIYYNGLETYMKGQISGNTPREYLLRVRKDQTIHISLEPADPGCTFAVLDEQGAQIGTTGKNWEWLTTFAGDLRIKVYPGPSGSKDFTLRVAPY